MYYKLLKLVLLGIAAILVILNFKAVIFGLILGILGTIVYFSLTNSVLNWRKK